METYKTKYRYEIRDEEGYLFNAYCRKPSAVAYADRKATEYKLATIYIIDRHTNKTIYTTRYDAGRGCFYTDEALA